MTHIKRRPLAFMALVSLTMALCTPAGAQDWAPTKPIRIIRVSSAVLLINESRP